MNNTETIIPDTIQLNTLDQLESQLSKLYQEAKTRETKYRTTQEKTQFREYARGFKDAMDLVMRYKQQSKKTESLVPLISQKAKTEPKKPYEMHAQDIVTLIRNPQKSNIFKTFPKEDLIETAFKFENELMQLLGDENMISFDSYIDLSTDQLEKIIINCTEKITQINS